MSYTEFEPDNLYNWLEFYRSLMRVRNTKTAAISAAITATVCERVLLLELWKPNINTECSSEHHGSIIPRDLRAVLNWTLIMPRGIIYLIGRISQTTNRGVSILEKRKIHFLALDTL